MTTEKNLFLRPMEECCLHINSELEVVFVRRGSVCIKLGNTDFQLDENQFTVISPYRLHGFEPEEYSDITVYMFPYTMASDFCSIYHNKDSVNKVFTLDQITIDYIVSATEKFLHNSGVHYAQSILHVFLAEFITNNSFVQMSFDASNVNRIIEYIYFNMSGALTIKDVAGEFSIKEYQLNNLLANYTGLGFREFLESLRVEKAITLLFNNDMNITEIAFESGFDNTRTFNRAFLRVTGCTPTDYRKKIQSN